MDAGMFAAGLFAEGLWAAGYWTAGPTVPASPSPVLPVLSLSAPTARATLSAPRTRMEVHA